MKNADSRFAKLNVKMWQNQKILKLLDENCHAFSIWTLVLTYCADNLTDGEFDFFLVNRFLGATEEDINVLLEYCFIEEISAGKYRIHDYEQYQQTSAELEERHKKAVEYGRLGAARRKRKNNPDVSDSEIEESGQSRVPSTPPLGYPKPTLSEGDKGKLRVALADKDKDKDKELDIKKENIKRKKSETKKTEPNPQSEPTPETSHTELTPTQDSEPSAELTAYPKHNPQQFADLTTRLKAIYPVARFDLETSHNQNLLEAYWFKVEQHAHKAGAVDPFSWLVSQTLDYVNATEPKYVKRFSKYFMEETYCQDWHNAERPMSRSEANLKHNLAYIRHLAELEAQGINPFAKEATV